MLSCIKSFQRKLVETGDGNKEKRARQFWEAYRACVEVHGVAPQHSSFYVHWGKEFFDFLPDKKLLNRYGVTPVQSPLDQ